MKGRKPNPDNSSTLQCLLDIEKVMKASQMPYSSDVLKAIQDIKSKLKYNDIKQIDDLYNSHKYPNTSLEYTKIFRECEIWENLSINACRILLRMIRKMSQDNCYLLNRNIIVNVLKLSKSTVIRALNELEEMNCIVKIASFRKELHGTVYMVNPAIANVGKDNNQGFYEQMVSEDQTEIFADNSLGSYDTIHSKFQVYNRLVSFNYEVIVDENN